VHPQHPPHLIPMWSSIPDKRSPMPLEKVSTHEPARKLDGDKYRNNYDAIFRKKDLRACERHGPEPHPYCVDCAKASYLFDRENAPTITPSHFEMRCGAKVRVFDDNNPPHPATNEHNDADAHCDP